MSRTTAAGTPPDICSPVGASRWSRPAVATRMPTAGDVVSGAGAREPYAGPVTITAWIGAHGGAGVSTLLRFASNAVELPARTAVTDSAAVVVCRGSADGLHAAAELLGRLHPREPLGVVVVAASPRPLPRAVTRRLRLLASATPHLWRIPWLEDAHRGTLTACPPSIRRALNAIDHRATQPTTTTGARP